MPSTTAPKARIRNKTAPVGSEGDAVDDATEMTIVPNVMPPRKMRHPLWNSFGWKVSVLHNSEREMPWDALHEFACDKIVATAACV
jgi:hypothetical protein